jgi:lipid II:glycine glycyltransferase (peptidoglycan interpeptide bridge formation enzyme)
MVVVRVADRAYYLYGASDRGAPPNSNGPYAAMAATFDALAEDGVRTFDLWGVDDPEDPHQDPSWAGFGAFKRRFGGVDLRHPGTFDLVVDRRWWLLRELRERLRARR